MSEENPKKINTDTLLNTFFDKVLTFSLSDSEKEAMSQKFNFETVSPFFTPRDNYPTNNRHAHTWYKAFANKKVLVSVFAGLLIVVLGGGTSLAARSAIPGDVLYPIKIHINEGAESFFSVGPKSIAKTHAIHAIARLEEVEKLALQDKLNATTTILAKAQFTEDANNVTQSVEKLSAEGDAPSATQVGADFQTSLQDHQDILTTLSEKGGNQSRLLSDIAGTVSTHLYATTAANLNIESGMNSTSTGASTTTPTTTPVTGGTVGGANSSGTTTATSSPATTTPGVTPGASSTTTGTTTEGANGSTSTSSQTRQGQRTPILKAKGR